ncbi:MAG: hypothetical protein ABIF77_05105 [bacterium]
MDRPDTLITALVDEDCLLRQLMAQWPPESRDVPGPGSNLSFKDTLGHLAFWDTFAVDFFTGKLGSSTEIPRQPVNFEEQSRLELERLRLLPFDEVLQFYSQATRGILDFLRENWAELSSRERLDFAVPLKHRRHHRLLLRKTLISLPPPAASRERA